MQRAIASLAFLAALLLATPSRAATNTVTTTADSGPGSLRDAIAAAAAGDTINFAVTGAITLTSGELLINKNLTVAGPGAGILTVERSTASGTPDFRVFHFMSGIVNASGLTVKNGRADGGGGINNETTMTLSDCVVTGNAATFVGGGVCSVSTLTMSNCVIRGNFLNGPTNCDGGGVYNGGTLTALNCDVSSNQASSAGIAEGGGIASRGTLTITNSIISANTLAKMPL